MLKYPAAQAKEQQQDADLPVLPPGRPVQAGTVAVSHPGSQYRRKSALGHRRGSCQPLVGERRFGFQKKR